MAEDKRTAAASERALAALEEARKYAPLDLLAEVVESRYQERRKQDRRWWISIVVAVFTAYVGTGALYVTTVERNINAIERIADRAEVEASVANRRLDTPQQAALLPSVETLQPGASRSILIGPDERMRFQLSVSGLGNRTYIIDAAADNGGVDPVLYLYEQTGGRIVTIASDDDGGGNLNSRIVENLDENRTYFVEVEEISGRSGSLRLSIQ